MNYNYCKHILFLLLPVLFGCDSSQEAKDLTDKSESILFGANITNIGNTRGYQEEGTVMTGKYNLTFQNLSQELEIGSVAFENGIGYASRIKDNKNVDLKWGEIKSDETHGTYSFYLDNLPSYENQNSTIVELPEDNPFRVDVFDKKNGKNDLLWGSLEDVNRSPILSFNLYHVMSRFCLRVYFDNSKGFENLPELKSASISNLFQKAISFDRLTGALGLNEQPDETPFILSGWVEDDEINEESVTYYVSQDYVIPPQEFVPNNRPRLTIVLENGDSYSGVFPLAMNLVGENDVLTPWNMSFLRGYKLTMTVRISNESQNLRFMPATLYEWVDKGTHVIAGNQAAIDDDKDFKDLIDAYNKCKEEISDLGYDDDIEDIFYEWGYYNKSLGKWIFNIFKNIEITEADIAGKMEEIDKLKYDFKIYSLATVTINRNNGDKVTLSQSEGEKLKALLNEGSL